MLQKEIKEYYFEEGGFIFKDINILPLNGHYLQEIENIIEKNIVEVLKVNHKEMNHCYDPLETL